MTNLAGVPSIVYGLAGARTVRVSSGSARAFCPRASRSALLILPIVIVATREAIRAVPDAIREAAYALGATRWQTVHDHVLPYSTGGILTGMILGLSRAIGETAPIITIGALTFIAFLPPSPITSEFPFISFEWLMAPFTVMPIQMFNWLSRPQAGVLRPTPLLPALILVVMTLQHERARDLAALPIPQENQMVMTWMGRLVNRTPASGRSMPANRALPSETHQGRGARR